MNLTSTRIALLLALLLFGGLGLSAEEIEPVATEATDATESRDEIKHSDLPLEESSETFLTNQCIAAVSCDDGTSVSCFCPPPDGGRCTSYPTGNPWGGYVRCWCSGSPFAQEESCTL